MAALLLVVLLSSQIFLSDALRSPALQHSTPEHAYQLVSSSPWSSRRALRQQIPTSPPQLVNEQPQNSIESPPVAEQQPPSPPEPPSASSNSATDASAVAPPSPAPAAPPSPSDTYNQRRTLQLPPHVYLISFVMLLAIMGGLLTCHCLRMCRIARRMRRAAELGVTVSAAGSMLSKRTPQSVIEALPVSKYSSIANQRHAASAAHAGSKGSAAAEAATATPDGSNRMNSFVAAAMQLREQFARQGALSFGTNSSTVPQAAAPGDSASAVEATQQLHNSSSAGSMPIWRRSLSFGRRTIPVAEISPAAGDESDHLAASTSALAYHEHAGRCSTSLDANPSRAPASDQSSAALVAAAAAVPGGNFVGTASHSTSSGAEPCAICFEDFSPDDDVKQLPCQHFFHVNCIDEWLIRDVTCPLCKGTVLNDSLIQQQQVVAAQLEASFGGLGGGSITRRQQLPQQQVDGSSRGGRSRSTRRSRHRSSGASAAASTGATSAAADDVEQQRGADQGPAGSSSSDRDAVELTSSVVRPDGHTDVPQQHQQQSGTSNTAYPAVGLQQDVTASGLAAATAADQRDCQQ